MDAPTELALVREAILSHVTGCCVWDEKEAERVRSDPLLLGLTPEYVRRRLQDFLRGGGEVKQVKEARPRFSHREFYYKAVFPEAGFARGLFVEMELTDDDPDVPTVTLFNAHPQSG